MEIYLALRVYMWILPTRIAMEVGRVLIEKRVARQKKRHATGQVNVRKLEAIRGLDGFYKHSVETLVLSLSQLSQAINSQANERMQIEFHDDGAPTKYTSWLDLKRDMMR